MTGGWIKLHRPFLKWEWYQDSKMVHLFIHLLLTANHETNKWQGIEIERGQLVTGLKKLSGYTGISVQSIRTSLMRLKSTSEITIKTTNKFSIITICNYDIYQSYDELINNQNNKQSNKQLTNKQQTTNNKQEYKNIRIKEVKENTFSENWEKIEETYLEFKKMRVKIRKPMTELAEIRIIEKLGKLSNKDSELAIKILEQSIIKDWQDVFDLKTNYENNHRGYRDPKIIPAADYEKDRLHPGLDH
jgi:hypothetical protein